MRNIISGVIGLVLGAAILAANSGRSGTQPAAPEGR